MIIKKFLVNHYKLQKIYFEFMMMSKNLVRNEGLRVESEIKL